MQQSKVSTILIVDDSHILLNVIKLALTGLARLLIAKNGQSALQLVEKQSIDLILLDVMMPEMDGYEVCKQLKSNPKTSSIPVIFLTSKDDLEDEANGLALGAVDYIRKPFNQKLLQLRVQNQLELSHYRHNLEEMVFARTQELENIRKDLSKAQEIAHLGSWSWDIQNGTLVWSDEVFRIFGLPPQSTPITYMDFLNRVHPDHQKEVDGAVQSSLTNDQKPYTIEHKIVRSDGTERTVQQQGEIVRDEEGQPIRMIGTLHDITEKKLAELAQIAQKVAEQTSREKSVFFAKMSHEIRTPMSGVIGMLHLLKRSSLTPHQRNYLNLAESAAQLQLSVINDILDFSKFESGNLKLEHIPFSPGMVAENILPLLAEQAYQKELELSIFIASDVPKTVSGDPTRLQQILMNLLNNAIKFTKEGSITLRLERVTPDESPGKVRLHFLVQDTGAGIPDEVHETIFKPFSQADNTVTRTHGGTGLGLVIVKQLVEAMQGTIRLVSKRGEGAAFDVSLPFDEALEMDNTEWTNPESSSALEDVPILVVDDSETARITIMQYLTAWGAWFDSAASGEAALKKMEAAERKGRIYRTILLDHDLPDMTGPELVQTMAQRWQTPLPHILLMTQRNTEILDAPPGADILYKPVLRQDLWKKLTSDLTPSQEPQEPTPQSLSLPTFSGRVLIVEDTFVNQEVARGLLEWLGVVSDIAENGLVALERMESQHFDLVLMDMQMPVMDGLEATTRIRSIEAENHTPRVPIIAVTANIHEQQRQECIQSGMDDFLEKPLSEKALIRVLEHWLVKDDPRSKKVSPPGSRKDMHNEPEVDFSEIHPVDIQALEKLKKLLCSVPGRYEELLEKYLQSSHYHLETIRQGLDNQSAEGIYKAAHPLKSQSASVGAMTLSSLCGSIESLGRANDLRGIEELLLHAKHELKRVEPILMASIAERLEKSDQKPGLS